MYIRSRVPLRISFGGGGTDVSPYCDEYGGVTLNATIDRYASVTLKPTKNEDIIVKSIDYDLTLNYKINEDFAFNGQLDLVKGVVRIMKEKFDLREGIEIYVQNDAPPGSGLGSSSAICVALIGAFKELLRLPLTPYDIAELAFKIERIDLGIKGGRQDQYAAAFGGFNFMEFYKDHTIVNPLRLSEDLIDELQYSLVIAYIGGSHEAASILDRQINNVKNRNQNSLEAMHKIKEIAIEMKNTLVMGKLGKFGKLLDKEWMYKKEMAEGITNEKIDKIYESAIKAGALGGKISGAGGGGYMFFFADFDKRYSVIRTLKEYNAEIIDFSFTNHGLRTWKVGEREDK
ncbi:MAG: GHMP kinase [Candidatus Parvarchaeota archaeon]